MVDEQRFRGVPRSGRRQGRPSRGRPGAGRHAPARRAVAHRRTQAAGPVRQARRARTAAGRRRPARDDRRVAGRGRPRRRAPGGLPARAGDAPHRRPLPRPGQDLRAGRVRPSPTPPAPCRTRCARSTSATTPWPNWTCWSDSTTTSPPRPPGSATASAACSPASPPLNAPSAPGSSHPAVLEILSRYGGPAGIAKAGRRNITDIAKAHAPRMGEQLVEAITVALTEHRHRPWHHSRGHGPAKTGRQPENRSATTQTSRRTGRRDARCARFAGS